MKGTTATKTLISRTSPGGNRLFAGDIILALALTEC